MYFAGDIIVKQFGDKIKLTFLKSPVGSASLPSLFREERENTAKLQNSISRTRSSVYEIAACNPWDYFATLTLDGEKRDRFDLDGFRKGFSQFLRNFNRLNGAAVKYLLIPEQHKDGAWHMHGLFSGLPDGALCVNRFGYLDWPGYSKRFGFMSLSPVRSHEACSAYITKYITKDMAARLHELGAHLYYASKGLKKAEPVGVYRLRGRADLPWDFENDWTKVLWVDKAGFEEIAPVVYNKL